MSIQPAIAAGFAVTRVNVIVSNSIFADTMDLNIAGNSASGTFETLPVGAYSIQVTVFDGETIIASGSGSGTVTAGAIAQVTVTLSLVGGLGVTVTWTSPQTLAVTAATLAFDADLAAGCQAEFGSGARVGDWNDVIAAMSAGTPAENIVPTTVGSALGTSGGEAYTSSLHYIISSVIHDGYAVVDSYTANGSTMWLGRWNGNYQVLCYKP